MQERITKHPTPLVIQEMGKCLDLEDILKKEETAEVKQEREKSLKKVMQKTKYSKAEKENIVKEYDIFKRKFKDINDVKSDSEEADVVNRFEHLLLKTNLCQTSCIKVVQKVR